MSALFTVYYRGCPVQFTFKDGASIWGVVNIECATPFTSEADAWHAASQHGIPLEHLSIKSRSPQRKEEGALL
jgi:hypothetical protein